MKNIQKNSSDVSNKTRPNTNLSTKNNSRNFTSRQSFKQNSNSEPKLLEKKLPDWGHSSATLRHTAYKFSFPKSPRFKYKNKENANPLIITIPSTITSKACTFGFGSRQPKFIQSRSINKETPPPGTYDLKYQDEQSRSPSKGKSFGIGWKHYKTDYFNHKKNVRSQILGLNSPPAYYQVRQKIGQGKRTTKLTGRPKMLIQILSNSVKFTPGPQYVPNDRLCRNLRGLNQRNFSFGQRLDFTKTIDTPGPKYNIASFTDKYCEPQRRNCYKQFKNSYKLPQQFQF